MCYGKVLCPTFYYGKLCSTQIKSTTKFSESRIPVSKIIELTKRNIFFFWQSLAWACLIDTGIFGLFIEYLCSAPKPQPTLHFATN